MTNPTSYDRMSGALWGALVGDALGVPVEFRSRETVQRNPVTGMRAYGTHNQPSGTWSDDSSMLLCTAHSLVSQRKLEPAALGKCFVRWKNEAFWTPLGSVFDIGIATSQAISRLASGTPPEEAGGSDEYSNGNGSLMRILPIALWFHDSEPEEMARSAEVASSLTHRHPRSKMASALYCLIVRELVNGTDPHTALQVALKTFEGLYSQVPYTDEMHHFRMLKDPGFAKLPERRIASSGYVIDTLTASVWCLLTSASFEETVLKAVNLGGDTDTTGTVAGGLAGALHGIAAIPSEWKAALARHDDVAELFGKFFSANQ